MAKRVKMSDETVTDLDRATGLVYGFVTGAIEGGGKGPYWRLSAEQARLVRSLHGKTVEVVARGIALGRALGRAGGLPGKAASKAKRTTVRRGRAAR